MTSCTFLYTFVPWVWFNLEMSAVPLPSHSSGGGGRQANEELCRGSSKGRAFQASEWAQTCLPSFLWEEPARQTQPPWFHLPSRFSLLSPNFLCPNQYSLFSRLRAWARSPSQWAVIHTACQNSLLLQVREIEYWSFSFSISPSNIHWKDWYWS